MLIKKDLKLIFAEKKFFIILLFVAVICFVGVSFGSNASIGSAVNIGICDNDNSEYSKILVSYFEDNDEFTYYMNITRGSEAELKELFEAGKLALYLVIPKDFAANLININNVPIKAVINSSDPVTSHIYKELLESYANYISSVEVACQALYDVMWDEGYSRDKRDSVNYLISYDLIFMALGKDSFFDRSYIDRFKGIATVNYYVYAGIAVLILYIGMFCGLSFLKDELSLCGARLKSAGISRTKRLNSKSLSYLLVFGLLMLAALFCLNGRAGFELGVFGFLLVFGALVLSDLFFEFLSLFFKDVSAYLIFSNMLILLLMLLGGGLLPVMYMPQALASFAKYTPVYQFIRLMIWGI